MLGAPLGSGKEAWDQKCKNGALKYQGKWVSAPACFAAHIMSADKVVDLVRQVEGEDVPFFVMDKQTFDSQVWLCTCHCGTNVLFHSHTLFVYHPHSHVNAPNAHRWTALPPGGSRS